MPYGDESCVAEIYRKRRKSGLSDIFHESYLILGSITDSLVADTVLEQLIPAINVKEAEPRRIENGKAKSNIAHKKGTVIKVLEKSRHSVVTPEHLAWTLNIGLDKAKQMLRVTNQCGIRTAVRPTSRR